MGGANSHHELVSSTSTPPPKPYNSKILEIDPRSPSAEISRTPIVVDKTPVSALDPRSPSVGIVRTPLTQLPFLEKDAEVAKPLPLNLDLDIDMESSGPKPDEDQTTPDDQLLDPLGDTEMSCMTLNDLPLEESESTYLVPTEEGQGLMSEIEKPKMKKKKIKTQQQKDLLAKKHSSEIRDVTRSPLSTRNIEMNSPLKIVQRKQTKKIDKARTCSSESMTTRFIVKDKENM